MNRTGVCLQGAYNLTGWMGGYLPSPTAHHGLRLLTHYLHPHTHPGRGALVLPAVFIDEETEARENTHLV